MIARFHYTSALDAAGIVAYRPGGHFDAAM
jgi:hypothetical protein